MWRHDVVSNTVSVWILSIWLLRATSLPFLVLTAAVAITFSSATRIKKSLFGVAVLVPIFPILVSHLGIEPLFAEGSVSIRQFVLAIEAWLRLASLALLSVSWLTTLSFTSAAALCRLVLVGQPLLVPLVAIVTLLQSISSRWTLIREAQALQRCGVLRRRTRLPISRLPFVGMQLTLASLVTVPELALSCEGRGVGGRRILAVRIPPVTWVGGILTLTLLAATPLWFVLRLMD
jgi:hypothetical protein